MIENLTRQNQSTKFDIEFRMTLVSSDRDIIK